ncbi:hypothetical protein [Glutamicibacter ardleyensis]|uniref:hypothetical protein n=1 Tax=Glutamicibacter ardleyensis TaxID=225894 RepID=UPI003FD31081
MTIKEILEAHFKIEWNDWGQRQCQCGHEFAGKYSSKAHRAHVAEVLEKHMQEREAQLSQLVRDMTDPGACWFDHHGGCQEHGYLDLKPGEQCPHTEAKQLLGDEPNGR